MGITIIYLEDQHDGIAVTAEHIGKDGKSQELATKIINSILFIQDVYYSDGKNLTGHPITPIIQ